MSITKVTAKIEDKTKELEKKNKNLYTGKLTAPLIAGDYTMEVSAYDNAGNVSRLKKNANVTLWNTPKTTWTKEDRFNIKDYNRIKNNLVFLQKLAVTMWDDFEISDMGEDITLYTAYWDVDIFNEFEKNLEKINQNIYTKNFGFSQSFFENGPFIKWDELNRIENATSTMYTLLKGQKSCLRRFAFRFGKAGRFRV